MQMFFSISTYQKTAKEASHGNSDQLAAYCKQDLKAPGYLNIVKGLAEQRENGIG